MSVKEVKCTCGGIIPDDNIYYWNACNEEGEDFCRIDATCPHCNKDFETSQWGECENKEEAKRTLDEYINPDNY